MRNQSLTALARCMGIALCLAIPQAMAAQTQVAQAETNASKSMSSQDRTFIKEAAVGGLYEVQAGQLASQKASSDQVKQMAQHIVTDHTQANEKLKSIAQAKGADVPTALDAKHQKKLDQLSKLSGADFDRQYSKMMVSDHKEDIQKFQKQAQSGSDPDLKQFASSILPALNQHLSMAQSGTHAAGSSGNETAGGQSNTQSPQSDPAQRNDNR
jgi:putative membrane protein